MGKQSIKRQRRIYVTDKIIAQLKCESGQTNQSILNALRFNSYSPAAKKIRNRAITLMAEVQKENQRLMNEFED